jgi:hypothetical protein
MKKILVLAFIICLIPVAAWATSDTFEGQTGTDTFEGQTNTDTIEGTERAVAAGGISYEINANFSGESNDTEIDAITDAWTDEQTAASGNAIKINTGKGLNSTSQCADAEAGTSIYPYYKAVTPDGQYYMADFYFEAGAVGTEAGDVIWIGGFTSGDAVGGWNSTHVLIFRIENGGNLYYHYSGASQVDTGVDLAADTSYHFEVELDLTNDTFDLWINDSLRVDNGTIYSSNPTRFNIVSGVEDFSVTWLYWDEVKTYDGQRQ